MAPRFRPWRPTEATFRAGAEQAKEKKTDPVRIAYELTHDAAKILVHAEKKGRTQKNVVNGYVARHLVDKGCLVRLPGRDTSYRITLRGEAVVEELRKREKMAYLFEPVKPKEI